MKFFSLCFLVISLPLPSWATFADSLRGGKINLYGSTAFTKAWQEEIRNNTALTKSLNERLLFIENELAAKESSKKESSKRESMEDDTSVVCSYVSDKESWERVDMENLENFLGKACNLNYPVQKIDGYRRFNHILVGS